MNRLIKKMGYYGFFLIYFFSLCGCVLKKESSEKEEYKIYIGRCYKTLDEMVLCKKSNGNNYIRFYLKKNYTGPVQYTKILDVNNRSISVSHHKDEKVLALIPKGSIAKIDKIFQLDDYSLGKHLQYIGNIKNTDFIGVDISDLFMAVLPYHMDNPAAAQPIDCSEFSQ